MTANSPPSPINKRYKNVLNSENLTEGFLSSTPVHSQKKFKSCNKYYYEINRNSPKNQLNGLYTQESSGEEEYLDYAQPTNFDDTLSFEADNSRKYKCLEIEQVTEANFKIGDDNTAQQERSNDNFSTLQTIINNQMTLLKNQQTILNTVNDLQNQLNSIEKKVKKVCY